MAAQQPTHILYHYHFSIASLFARFTYALRGSPKDADQEIRLKEQIIDLVPPALDNLSEYFLCDVNSAGEVPVLATVDGRHIIPDSLDITFHIAQVYPRIVPEEHREQIKQLLRKLHQISFHALTFNSHPEFDLGKKNLLEERLKNGGITARYREAIEYKLQRMDVKTLPSLRQSGLEDAVSRTESLVGEVRDLLNQSRTGWMLSTPAPTALDAHLVVFICRLQDIGRDNLILDRVKEYAETAMQMPEWQETMQGRRTVPPAGF